MEHRQPTRKRGVRPYINSSVTIAALSYHLYGDSSIFIDVIHVMYSIKCYKFFGEPTSFSQAEYTCNVLQGKSTLDRFAVT